MVYFNINIRNPAWWNRFESIKSWHGGPKKDSHKAWEIQIMKCSELFRIEFEYTIRQDHAGVKLEMGLFGYQIDFSWYDTRHWYVEKGRWIDYSNPKDQEEIYGKNWNK
jgi:hypothetical protein